MFEPVIGLEIHAQLLTRTKIFCGCSTAFGQAPNSAVCPVCLGLPGALPVVNRRVVLFGVRAALALGCRVHDVSEFARKNYFYPDLPKGYQISQYDRPLATGGRLDLDGPDAAGVRIERLHLEEDAGKSLHHGFPDSDRATYVDFNRAGVPLAEIVTAPDLRSAAQAARCFQAIREVLVAIGVNDGNMEEGSLRCDANVSMTPVGVATFGTKVEIKNVNSFKYLQKALEFEIARQVAVLERGDRVRQETRLWDSDRHETVSMRSKEEAHDYRYFPEPDLPPLRVEAAWCDEIRAGLPELPGARVQRLVRDYGLGAYDADVLVRHMEGAADYFEATVAAGASAKPASNWIQGELRRRLKDQGGVSAARAAVTPAALAALVGLVDRGALSTAIAREVFDEMWHTGRAAADIVRDRGLGQRDDETSLSRVVAEVLAAHPAELAEARAGRERVLGFLVGRVLRAAGGTANPQRAAELVRRAVNGG